MSRNIISCLFLCLVVTGVRGKSSLVEDFLKTIERKLFAEQTCECFEWNGLCFWLNTEIPTVVKHAYPVDIHVGVASNCGEDGHPANIYTEEQYTLMMEYLRTKIEVIEGLIDWTIVYTGMTFDPLTKTLFYNNGKTAMFTSWYPGFPLTGPHDLELKGLELKVDINPDNPNQGMLNNLSRGLNQVMCEKHMKK